MRAELTLTAILVLRLPLRPPRRRARAPLVLGRGVRDCWLVQVAVNSRPGSRRANSSAGCSVTPPMDGVVKSILSIGALIVCLQADPWLRREDTRHKQGEFYILTLSTLLGMYFMISAGHFLMFFIGLELASVPMACLVAFDKYRHHSAEAGAKYILCALFSSGLMLFGISFLYGTTGTLYFDDMAARLDRLAPRDPVAGLLLLGPGLQDLARALPPLDGRRLPGRPDGRHLLPLGRLEGRGRVRALHDAGQGLRPAGRAVADAAVGRHGAEHHRGQPLRPAADGTSSASWPSRRSPRPGTSCWPLSAAALRA